MDEHLKALHDTLKAAGDGNATAHIPARQAKEGAEAIQRVLEEGDKTAASELETLLKQSEHYGKQSLYRVIHNERGDLVNAEVIQGEAGQEWSGVKWIDV